MNDLVVSNYITEILMTLVSIKCKVHVVNSLSLQIDLMNRKLNKPALLSLFS